MLVFMQSFDVSMAPVALAAIPSTRNVITASNKLHILRCMKQRVQQHMPVCAIYNPVVVIPIVSDSQGESDNECEVEDG